MSRRGRVIITARAPEPPPPSETQPGYPRLNGMLASWADVRVAFLTEDGEQIELVDVQRVSFTWAPGNNPLVATIDVFPGALEVEAIAELVEVEGG